MMESDLPPGSCNSTGHLSTIGYHTLPGRMHHSASTPAGVDGAGGGSRTPPATPKKGGKMLAVRVQMLDDTISMFQIQSKALGRVLFEQVCRQLHLLEADYFGLEYQDANSTRYWLDVEKPICRQLGLSMLEPTLRFCVKFYTPDPARLEEEFTRYLFCLQVKRDLAHGCIQCNENTAALMASYIVQDPSPLRQLYTPDPARLEEEFTRYLFCLQVKRDLAHGCIQCNENTAALMASYIVQGECIVCSVSQYWLDPSPLRQLYTPDPARLEEEFTRYLFCLQVKRDLAHGCIQCNENTAALMASYIVQAECGDFVPEDYPDHTYLSGYKFFPGQDSESERRIMENHKKHIGQSPAEADLNLLETARRCELYGVKMHPAKDHDNVPLNLAVAHMGIVVFQNFTKINTFSWAKIRKISFKRKKFLIKLHPEGYGAYRDVVEFFFEGRNECKNFWKKCVENHGFFRCSSVPRPARHKTRVISRGSSFRYSGKTQKQIVEFVRDNYVKRQTFQRAGSFRASRSAGGSRASVAARDGPPPGLGAAVSAHPLLPLPPGSDAISLEWDKQPHYLEASLMMKGYSAEEARAAARRTARRCSEAATRPPLAATAYATTRDKLSKLYCSQIDAPELVTRAEVNHHPTEDSPPPHRTTTPSGSPENTWSRGPTTGGPGRGRAPTPPPRAPPRRPSTDDAEDETENTVSSASLCMSPAPAERTTDSAAVPLCASTPLAPRTLANGHDAVDSKPPSKQADVINGNVNVVVSESTYSMDVLSGGESDAGDTLRRQTNNNNNSISSGLTTALRDGTMEGTKRRGADVTYFIAKELLMTERTYKRDLELVTVSWSRRVSGLAQEGSASGTESALALARACLALEPLALSCGALLARLDRVLAAAHAPHHVTDAANATDARTDNAKDQADANDNEEPEYKKIAEILCEHLTNTYEAYSVYTSRCGAVVGLVESVRRRCGSARAACAALEATSPLPLAALLLRPPHRLLHLHDLAHELYAATGGAAAAAALQLAARAAQASHDQLRHVENHAALCQLQRDIIGFDKLLVAEREFIRMGCVYKHSTRGLQQRMLFLFSDVLVVCSRGAHGQFRAHAALALRTLSLAHADLPHSFMLEGPDVQLLISASNEQEYLGWAHALDQAIAAAPSGDVDTELTPYEQEIESSSAGNAGNAGGAGGALSHVCWHRATALARDQLHLAMRTQLSGYLLRKFKKSPGWQKLWVVFALFTLFFYKNWQDDTPLASLPLLGYAVGPPEPADGIDKDFVFKLQFKNHVYFFRADSIFTYNRWVEVLRTSMVRYDHS